jgi:hypothetical protein
MQNNFFGLIDFVLIVFVISFNFFFLSMWKILYGKWFRIPPTWEWLKDIHKLKILSEQAETIEVRKKCKFILIGIYGSIGLLFVAILIGMLLRR